MYYIWCEVFCFFFIVSVLHKTFLSNKLQKNAGFEKYDRK